MSKKMFAVDQKAAEDRLMKYLAIDGQSGEERAIAEAVVDDLKKVGLPASAFKYDDADKKITLPVQIGNLYVTIPGTRPGPGLVFATHLDVVPVCKGARPKRKGGKIVPEGKTGLGGDNRTGCAVLSTLAQTLLNSDLEYPDITLLYTVREESGLQGAANMNPKLLNGAKTCFNFDGKLASDLITGAVGAQSWDVHIDGKASHAGVAPEKGISSTMVAALALADVKRGGWWGKVKKGAKRGTSNAGVFAGKDGLAAGNATNVVTDYVYVRGEARSPDAKFAAAIAQAYGKAFAAAGKAVKDDGGASAKVKFKANVQYPPFHLPESAPAVKHAKRAAQLLGMKPQCVFSNGGLDANFFAKYGLATVTLGAGQHEIHTIKEFVDLAQFAEGCQIAVALATLKA
jgi:tripeptide aminopeptidase